MSNSISFLGSRLNRNLALRIVLFSTVITVFVTIIQLLNDFTIDYRRIESEQGNIIASYNEPLAFDVWIMNETLIQSQLSGISRLPDIAFVSLETINGKDWHLGNRLSSHVMEKSLKLQHAYMDGKEIILGTLLIQSDLRNVYKRIFNKALMILLTNGFKTFLVAGFIMYLVNRYITVPLNRMISYFQTFKLDRDNDELVLKREGGRQGDEVELTAKAINHMCLELSSSYVQSKKSEKQLSQALKEREQLLELSQQAETRYRQSYSHLQDMYNTLPIIVWSIDANGIFTLSEGKELSTLGLKAGEVVGLSALEMYRDNEVILHSLEEGLKGIPGETEVTIDGVSYHVFTIPIREEDSNSYSLNGIAINITEKLKAEEELWKLRNYLSNIINSMPSALVGVNNECKITQWNIEAERKTGLSQEQSIGLDFAEVMPEIKESEEKIRNTIARREQLTESQSHQLHNGQTVYENVTIYPLVANGVEGAVIRVDDVTREQQLKEQLNHSRKMEAIGALAGGIAHDFNNMLGGIMGAAEMLTFYLPEDEKAQLFHKTILDASHRAADLTNSLLTFSRHNPQASTVIDMHQVVEEATELLANTIDRKITIEMDLNADVATVVGDSSQLQSALLNLGINGAHAMAEGGRLYIATREVELDKMYCNASVFDLKPGYYIEVEVRDSGTGIPAEHLERIFDPFFTTKQQGKGTGLGLAAVYGCVQQHGGAIHVYSEPGAGSTFQILLPLTEKMQVEIPSGQSPIKGSGKILVVDDEEIMRITARAILEELGYDITTAVNGQQAVDIYKENSGDFDLVILDMIMPVMNGSECFSVLKEYNPEVRVVLSSGFSREEDLKEMRKNGMLGFIRKPYLSFNLSEIVKEFVV